MVIEFSGSPDQGMQDHLDHVEELRTQAVPELCMFCGKDLCACWVTDEYCPICREPNTHCLCLLDDEDYGTAKNY